MMLNLDLVMPMYKLIEYSSNYSETAWSLWFYSKDEAINLMKILLMIIILNILNISLNYYEKPKLMELMEF